jgi:ribosomal protein S18 acetylase RimI-like enzyme
MIQFLVNRYPDSKSIISLYEKAQLIRPVADEERIAKMFVHSNFIISVWDGLRLVGILRALTDNCYSCFISDLAVDPEYRGRGIGTKLMELTQQNMGSEVSIFTLENHAKDLWQKLDMDRSMELFSLKRTK